MEILGYRQKLQNASTGGNGNALQTYGYCREHTFYITPTTGVSTGAIQIETADESTFTGAWAPLGPELNLSTGSAVVNHTGSLRAVRCRISSNVAGGTVTVMAVGN
jgi:hypothetical protein